VIDLTGTRLGEWSVLHRGPDYFRPCDGAKRARWWCQCSCGDIKLLHSSNLYGATTRCLACFKRERADAKERRRAEIQRLRKQGLDGMQIARETGIPPTTVYRHYGVESGKVLSVQARAAEVAGVDSVVKD
jgi:Homeodomain-like domain